MRKGYTNILNKQFHTDLIHTRARLGISQEEMASRLMMAGRTYVELDHGKSGCSALTLVLYLIYICPKPMTFLDELRMEMDRFREAA